MANTETTHSANEAQTHGLSARFILWLVLIAMVLLASNMRAPIVALGSVAPIVQDALSITETQIGWLGALPMLMFALGAFISPKISKHFGIENVLIAMIALLTVGIVVRTAVADWWWFMSGTLLLSLAIGFANTLAAPVIKQRTPNNIPLVTGVFSLTLTIAAGIVAGVVLPLSESVGWQWALGIWALLGVLTLGIWIFLRAKLGSSRQAGVTIGESTSQLSMWRLPFAWQIAIFLGLQSLLFYTVASFLPSIWISKGLSPVAAGQMATVFQFMAPVAILGLTWLVRRGQPISVTALGAGLLNVIGCAGIAYLPAQTAASTAWLWSALIGLGTSAIFTLCIMLFSLRTHTTDQARDLSGMAQTVGYLIAFLAHWGLAGCMNKRTTGTWR